MKALREHKDLSLRKLGNLMTPPLKPTFLCDLEHGRRNWNPRLINQYRKVCL